MPTADGSGPGTMGDGFYLIFFGRGMDFKSCFSYVTHLVSDGSSARLGMGPRGV